MFETGKVFEVAVDVGLEAVICAGPLKVDAFVFVLCACNFLC